MAPSELYSAEEIDLASAQAKKENAWFGCSKKKTEWPLLSMYEVTALSGHHVAYVT